MSNNQAKTTRPFTMIPDDIIRSPYIDANELRLFEILLTYCDKRAKSKTCEVAKEILASHMGITIRGVTRIIRRLEIQGLVSVEFASGDQASVYTMDVDPPASICPDEFKGRRIKSTLAYIREQGGVKSFQRRKLTTGPKIPKRTGWPKKSQIPSPTTHKMCDVKSLSDSGHDPGVMSESKNGMTLGSPPHDPGVTPDMTLGSPSNRVKIESFLERPNGLIPDAVYRRLGDLSPPTPKTPKTEERRECRAASNEVPQLQRSASENKEKDMGETAEQKEARRARLRAQKKGTRDKASDLKTAEESAKRRSQRARSRSAETSSGKLSPVALYSEFVEAVKSKYPNAILARSNDGRYLAWGKRLISSYDKGALSEMIKIIVLDYESIDRSRKHFFKFSGTAHPTFEQFQGNAAMLAGLVGLGVIDPPGIRYSAYADDYNKRHGKSANSDPGKQESGEVKVDPIQALRDQVNG